MTTVMMVALTGCALGAVPADPLATLVAGHPRLILPDGDLPRVRAALADPVARRWHEQLQHEAQKLLSEPPTAYKIVGPRLLAASRSVLSRVYTLGLIYRLDGNEAAGKRAVAELAAAAAWPQWNPSHFLDTAELNHAFGIGYDWLQPLLGEHKEAIRGALLTKGLEVARQAYRHHAWWSTCHHNWNQVCNMGNAIGALAVADEQPELAREILTNAVQLLPLALRAYAPDGGWAEGPGYWHYATRYTVYGLAAMETALGTDFGLSDVAGLSQAGDFRVYFGGPSGYSFNYADAGSGKLEAAEELLWLARRFKQPVYAWEERRGQRPHALDLIWFTPDGADPKAAGLPLDRWFKGVDVVFLRGDWLDPKTTWVAFKGGDNRANHSHLDLGCFVLDALGERWFSDLGPDNYNLPGYFGNKRWTYYRLNTHGQNTLVLDDQNQSPAAKARVVAFESTPQRAFGVVDLSKAWPMAKSVKRGIALLDRRDVLICDEVRAEQPVSVVWTAHTAATVQADGTRASLQLNGQQLYCRLVAPAGARFQASSAHREPPENHNTGFSKLQVVLPEPVRDLRLVLFISPVADATAPDPGPLAGWSGARP